MTKEPKKECIQPSTKWYIIFVVVIPKWIVIPKYKSTTTKHKSKSLILQTKTILHIQTQINIASMESQYHKNQITIY